MRDFLRPLLQPRYTSRRGVGRFVFVEASKMNDERINRLGREAGRDAAVALSLSLSLKLYKALPLREHVTGNRVRT